MANKFDIDAFLKLSGEEQAKFIERQTKELVKKLPTIRNKLKMYNDTSDEMYNLRNDEVELIGQTYARALRGGEISTPSAKASYRRFIQNLNKYARTDIGTLAKMTAEQRMESFMEHIRKNASDSEVKLAEELFQKMSDSDKLGFTRSKLFLDVENWNSEDFKTFIDNYGYSISFVKFQEYMKQKGYDVDEVYIKRKK